jgi:formamidopyrimidine-DNA glycosylase
MPELPEVETVRRVLERQVIDRRITEVGGRSVQMRRRLDVELLTGMLRGRSFSAARRRGKFLLLDVAPAGSLLVHLGMSGRLLLEQPEAPRLPHTHLVLALDDDVELRFVDPRRFGLACWLPDGTEDSDPSLAVLGVEPLDKGLVELLPTAFHTRRAPLKSLLLDQRLVAGVGNIYACEALWRARLRPSRRGSRTSLHRLERLAHELQAVLHEAVEQGGTTIRDYSTPAGDFGYFAVSLQVYGKVGRPCPRCGEALRDARLAGRTTAWCARCQT